MSDKKKDEPIEGFKAVAYMRTVRDKISSEIAGMSAAEIVNYFQKRRKLLES